MDVWLKEQQKNKAMLKKKKENRDKQDKSKMSVTPTSRKGREILAAELDRIGLYYSVNSTIADRQMILGEFHFRSRVADEGECVNLLHFTAVKPN
jgi:hypothetical protein